MRIACLLLIVLAGCGGLTREQRAANTAQARKSPGKVLTDAQLAALDQDKVMVCGNEAGTGSHIPHRVCRPLRRTIEQANNVQTSMSQGQQSSGWNASVTSVRADGN